jgi:hypothetical protein
LLSVKNELLAAGKEHQSGGGARRDNDIEKMQTAGRSRFPHSSDFKTLGAGEIHPPELSPDAPPVVSPIPLAVCPAMIWLECPCGNLRTYPQGFHLWGFGLDRDLIRLIAMSTIGGIGGLATAVYAAFFKKPMAGKSGCKEFPFDKYPWK